jgi:hypothetical protein
MPEWALLRTVIRSQRSSAPVVVESSATGLLSKSCASNLASRISQVFKRHSASTAAKERRPSKKWTPVFSMCDMLARKRPSASAHERDQLFFPQPSCREGSSFFLSVRVARSSCSPWSLKLVHFKCDTHDAPPAQSFLLRTKSLHDPLHSIPLWTLKWPHVRLELPIETGT